MPRIPNMSDLRQVVPPEMQRYFRLTRHEAAARIGPLNAAVDYAVPTVILPEGAINLYAHHNGDEAPQEIVYRVSLDEMEFAFDRLRDRLIAYGRMAGGIVFRTGPQVTVDEQSHQVIVWALCWFHPRHVIEELRAGSPRYHSIFSTDAPLRWYPSRPTPVQVWNA